MAYRCKVCGYKFKKGDSDLCPECFTARDDINCTDISGHTHVKDGTNDKGEDFISQQLREEQEITQKHIDNIPPPTPVQQHYDKVRSEQQLQQQFKQFKSYQMAEKSINGSSSNGFQSSSSFKTYNSGVGSKAVKRIVITFLLIFILGTVLSVVIPLIMLFVGIAKGDYNTSSSASYESAGDVSGAIYDEYVEEAESLVNFSNITVVGEYQDISEFTNGDIPQGLNIIDKSILDRGAWVETNFDISIVYDTAIIEGVIVSAYDENDNMIYSAIPYVTGSSNPLLGVEIPVYEYTDKLIISVVYEDPLDGGEMTVQGTIEADEIF